MTLNVNEKIERLRGKLIVSCQALPDEPLHSSFIMGRMALAASQGGAMGIRANTRADIVEIKRQVDLPVIGIVKKDYPDSEVYITPTMAEVDELMAAAPEIIGTAPENFDAAAAAGDKAPAGRTTQPMGAAALTPPEIIAMDATGRLRPGGVALADFYEQVRRKYPEQLLMADCSTVEEALYADRLGFDFIGTTMVGYTPQSRHLKIESNDFEILRKIVAGTKHRVIAEGNIDTPEKARRVIELGAYCVVVGSIITRPQVITKRFTEVL